MSVKLPILTKRQPIVHQRSPYELNIQNKYAKEVIQSADLQENYENEVEYQQEQFTQSQKPIQTIVCLKKNQKIDQQQLSIQIIKNKQEINMRQNKFALSQLECQLEEKLKLTSQMRSSIGNKKKEIRMIGDQVDKDLNKSILKVNKNTTINLRDIFSALPKSVNNRINQIQEQLKRVRTHIKKTKTEVQKELNSLTDTISIMNQQRGSDFETKIKKIDEEIKLIQDQKQMLNSQLIRKDFNLQEQKQKNDQFDKIHQQLSQLINLQKEQKSKIYFIQKQDILLMQKGNFFKQKEGNVGNIKKSRVLQKDKSLLDREIKQIIEEINQIIDDRNRTQLEKKQTVKNLITQSANLESKNWQICNKLRDIDAFLLQYYQKKSRKKQVRPVQKNAQSMQKSASNKIEVQSVLQTPKKTKQRFSNDKNMKSYSSEAIVVEKRKNYEFFLKQEDQDLIVLSDQFLGSKLSLTDILIIVDQQKVYRIVCTYKNNHKKQTKGLTMGSKKLPKITQQLGLKMDFSKNQVINFIHVGFHENQHISYLQIITSQKNKLEWGNIQKLYKSQQKYIKKYQSAFVKSKIALDKVIQNENQIFCVYGITLSTIYLTSK